MEESNQIQHYQVTDLGMGQVTMLDVVLDVCSNRSRMFASHTGLLLRSDAAQSQPTYVQVGIVTGQAFGSLEELLFFFYSAKFPDPHEPHVQLTSM